VKPLAAIVAALALSSISVDSQQASRFKFVFKGMCYQREGTNIVGVPITEQTLLAATAAARGVNPKTLTMVYHLGADERGDTVEVVHATTGESYGIQFAFWFGDDRTMKLGRTALTNSALTEIRRVDQLFTLSNTAYTSDNSHGVGSAFTTKRFVKDSNGVVHATMEGPIQWLVNPHGTNTTAKICHGTFIASQPLF